uniref:Uncharacterized protein n=1 Tax=Lotharella globosa TaxID=91324 RepID=A0A7S3YG98_9EUKA
MGCGASPGEKKATGEAEGTPGNQQQEQLPGEEKGGQGAASGAPSVDKDPAKPQAGVDRKGNTEQESKDDQDGGYNDKEKKNSEGAAKPKASDQKVGTDKPSGTPPKPSIDDMSKPPEWLTKSNTKKHLSFHAEYKGHYRIPSDPNISMTEYLQIKTEDEYKSFVSTIPLNKIQMKQPAPPSDDALLAFPPIDFQNRMLLVVLRFDSMYKAPVITSVCQTRARTRRYQSGWTPWTTSVTYQHPDIGDTAACSAPEGIGE